MWLKKTVKRGVQMLQKFIIKMDIRQANLSGQANIHLTIKLFLETLVSL